MNLKLNDHVYNVLKWIALIALPAIEVLWTAIATTWNLPCVKEVAATIAAIDACLGALLGLSCYQYKKEEKENGD